MGLVEPKKKKEFLRKTPGVFSPAPPTFEGPVTVIDDMSGTIERLLTFISDTFDDNEVAIQAKKITDYLHRSFPFATNFVLATDDGAAPKQKEETHKARKRGNVDDSTTRAILDAAKKGATISREEINKVIPTIAKKGKMIGDKTGWAQFHTSRAFRNMARDKVTRVVIDNVAPAKHIFTYYRGSLKSADTTVDVAPCIGEADIKFGHVFVSNHFADHDLIISSRDSDILVIYLLLRSFIPRESARRIFWYDSGEYYNLSRIADTYPNSVALAIAFMQAGTDYVLHSCIKNEEPAFLATYNFASTMDDFDAARVARVVNSGVRKLPHHSQAPLEQTARQLWWNLVYWRNCADPSDEEQTRCLNDLGIGRNMLHLRATAEARGAGNEEDGGGLGGGGGAHRGGQDH